MILDPRAQAERLRVGRPLYIGHDVPSSPTRKMPRRDFVALLQSRPGVWAQYKPGVAHSMAAASVMQHDFPGLETTYRRRDEGGFDVYARWVG